MSTHKYIDRLCAAAVILCLLLTIAFMNGKSLGLQSAASSMSYEARLFDTQRVHTIDIVMDDWDSFIENCENEEYAQCAVIIDGEAYKNTGIRAKGNTSLSMVSTMNSSRYSFKLEFDHYESGKSYYGLDKLSLNNIIQDTTYMKDYLTYQMMGAFGVDAPLCSYVYITVNGEDWGLYLAVEGVEDAFLRRNYGNDPGELYKPDSTGFGGGRGNGRAFNMEDFMGAEGDEAEERSRFIGAASEGLTPPAFFEGSGFPPPQDGFNGNRSVVPEGFGEGHENSDEPSGRGENRENSGRQGGEGHGNGGFGGMGSDDVKLKYIDDDPDSYANIFQNAKTNVTTADQDRLIAALKTLGSGEDIESVVDVDEVIRYFVVHNFVCNGDSYTGALVHNYYLYEENGQLSMIPWDYNLAFGAFQGGDAASTVNAPIDTPVSGGDSRPMVDWIFNDEAYMALYHQYFQEFLDSVDIAGLIGHAAELIAPYVEKDPTAFYTYEEFEKGVESLRTFCLLRAESVSGQLDGSIPSTEKGQTENPSALIDASSITLTDMGTMAQGGGFGGGGGNGTFRRSEGEQPFSPDSAQETNLTLSGQPLENEAEIQSVEALRQNPPERPDGNGFPQVNGFPGGKGFSDLSGGAAPALSESSLILTAASLGILFIGLLFAFIYRRRRH